MTDLAHTIGSDLAWSATGDLAISTGTQATQERVLRRLLTAPGAYIWQPQSGAGLGAFVGQPANGPLISAIVTGQMQSEADVASSPAPQVSIVVQPSGEVDLTIVYADANGATQTIQVP